MHDYQGVFYSGDRKIKIEKQETLAQHLVLCTFRVADTSIKLLEK